MQVPSLLLQMPPVTALLTDTTTNLLTAIEAFKNELHKIRTGRAHPGLLDQVHVDGLLRCARSNLANGHGHGAGHQIIRIYLVTLRGDALGHIHQKLISWNWSMRSVAGLPSVAAVYVAIICAAVSSNAVTASMIAACQRGSGRTRLVQRAMPPHKLT